MGEDFPSNVMFRFLKSGLGAENIDGGRDVNDPLSSRFLIRHAIRRRASGVASGKESGVTSLPTTAALHGSVLSSSSSSTASAHSMSDGDPDNLVTPSSA